MAYYDQVIAEPHDRIFLEMMGLFHSAMKLEQKNYLIGNEPFKTYLRNVTDEQWTAMVNRLKAYGLLAPKKETEKNQPYTQWNCHPLVREHFREVFQKDKPEDYRETHKVLFEYFDKAPQPPVGTPQQALLPFYRAIHHGCQAGLYKDSIMVYKEKLLRNDAQAEATNRLGMISEDVAALRRFFGEKKIMLSDLPIEDIDFLWGRMAFCLTCQGRLDEAVNYRKRELAFFEERTEPMGISGAKENLSGLYLMQGQLTLAKDEAEDALRIADEAQDWGKKMRAWSRIGAACYLRGEISNCKEAFNEAEKLQRSGQPTRPWMHSDYGIYYRLYKIDVAETIQDYKDILDEASGAMQHGDDRYWLVPSGFDALVKAVALWRKGDTSTASNFFDQSKSMLESSGAIIYLPLYLLPRAFFDLEISNDIEEAKNHVDEAARIANEYRLPLMSIDADLMLARIAIKDKSDKKADEFIKSARNSVIEYSYQLRWTDIALLEAELAVLRGDNHAERRIEHAEKIIKDSTRLSLLDHIEVLKNKYRHRN